MTRKKALLILFSALSGRIMEASDQIELEYKKDNKNVLLMSTSVSKWSVYIPEDTVLSIHCGGHERNYTAKEIWECLK